MPIYEYRCKKCDSTFEIMQRFQDPPLRKCPECGGKARRLVSNTSFILKGSGWYVTDYGSRKEHSKAEKKDEEKKGSSSKEKKGGSSKKDD